MALIEDQVDEKLFKMRHSAAHVLAQAVLELYPEARLGIGPPIAEGFYYDFDLGTDEEGKPRAFTPEDLKQLESRMKEIIKEDLPFEYREVEESEAREFFTSQPYKLELIEGLVRGELDPDGGEIHEAPVLSTYRQGPFEDLCRGPHVERTGQIPGQGLKLMSVASAYWRGDANNASMQRVYGTVWPDKKRLKHYLRELEEARKRDHRKVGKELEIFTFDEEVGPGLPLWLPNGGVMITELEKLAQEKEFEAGYERVRTPHLTKESLFLRSGHLPYYEEGMFPPMEMEGVRYFIKPMNCHFHHKIFGSRLRSYRELPLRLAEYGTCYRYEKSGELFGLMRVRSLQMNDAHIYCTEEQFEDEFMSVIRMYQDYFALFGIERYFMRFSTHHERGLGKKYVDEPELWQKTEELVRETLNRGDVPYKEIADEAAFYGPKIDVQIYSAIGREFTLATNQVDFAQPSRFDLEYTAQDGSKKMPLCLHRAPLSTHERFIGFLIEHYGGAFPLWLAPEQVRVVTISEAANDYAEQIVGRLRSHYVRATADLGSDRMQAKIRNAQLKKIPYIVVVGEKERESSQVALRLRTGEQRNEMPLDEFEALVIEKIRTRSSEL